MSKVLNRFVSWLHAGYPNDVPLTDHVPLVALLTRDAKAAVAGGTGE